jgi:hypothetical protein
MDTKHSTTQLYHSTTKLKEDPTKTLLGNTTSTGQMMMMTVTTTSKLVDTSTKVVLFILMVNYAIQTKTWKTGETAGTVKMSLKYTKNYPEDHTNSNYTEDNQTAIVISTLDTKETTEITTLVTNQD